MGGANGDTKLAGIMEVLGIGIFSFAVMAVVFVFLRSRFPRVYDFRKFARSNGGRRFENVGIPSRGTGSTTLSWLWASLSVSESEVQDEVGLDAMLFLRFVRRQLVLLASIAFVTCLILMPIYGTANHKHLASSDPKYVEGLSILSLSNVQVGSSRLWATFLVECFVTFLVVYLAFVDISFFAERRREFRIDSSKPENFAIVVYDIPPTEATTEAAVKEKFDLLTDGAVKEVVLVDSGNYSRLRTLKKEVERSRLRVEKSAKTRKQGRSKKESSNGGVYNKLLFWKTTKNNNYEEALSKYRESLFLLREERAKTSIETGRGAFPFTQYNCSNNGHAAIVVFSKMSQASMIVQANIGSTAVNYSLDRAPHPKAVHWGALGIPQWQVFPRAVAVWSFVFVLTLFWLGPATLVSGLANLSALSMLPGFKWAAQIADSSPAVVGTIENLLPGVLLSIILVMIPMFIRIATLLMRKSGLDSVEAKTRDYFYFFTINASFLFLVVGGAFLSKLPEMIENPVKVTSLLAAGVPKNDGFFASFVILRTFIPLGLLLLSPVRLILQSFRLRIADSKRKKAAVLDIGREFPYYSHYGTCMMISLIGIGYCCLAPIVSLCCLAFFALAYPIFKFTLLYTTFRTWEGSGKEYPGAFYGSLVGLLVQQATMIGVFVLFEIPYLIVGTVVLFLLTATAIVWCYSVFSRVSTHGSLSEQCLLEEHIEVPQDFLPIYRNQLIYGDEQDQDTYDDEEIFLTEDENKQDDFCYQKNASQQSANEVLQQHLSSRSSSISIPPLADECSLPSLLVHGRKSSGNLAATSEDPGKNHQPQTTEIKTPDTSQDKV